MNDSGNDGGGGVGARTVVERAVEVRLRERIVE